MESLFRYPFYYESNGRGTIFVKLVVDFFIFSRNGTKKLTRSLTLFITPKLLRE